MSSAKNAFSDHGDLPITATSRLAGCLSIPSTLENQLRKVTSPEFQYLYDDLFENITLYENRAKSATYTRLPDGKYQVNLAVELKKFRANGPGEEHQIPTHDWVDIGVTALDGHYLYLQKHKLEGESANISVVVGQLPVKAGIDPLNKLIDRKPDDNVMRVRAAH